jgi:hypothetical protein
MMSDSMLLKMSVENVLFRIISRISEYSRKNSPQYSVSAFHNNTMAIRVKKVLIQQNIPTSMKHLPAAVRMNGCHAGFRNMR